LQAQIPVTARRIGFGEQRINPVPFFCLALSASVRRKDGPGASAFNGKPLYDEPMFTPRPIAYIHSPYHETSKIPKGLGVKHDAEGVIEFLREYEAGLLDIEGFSYLYVLWHFNRVTDYDLVATPPADESRPHGVFATRSPRRPNPIGLTVVELLGHEGASLFVRGVDMLDGTPVLDVKPYMSSIPAEKLRRGWLTEAEARKAVES
jgi:tRNA (adenine37-N6)-methyltransferase